MTASCIYSGDNVEYLGASEVDHKKIGLSSVFAPSSRVVPPMVREMDKINKPNGVQIIEDEEID